MHGPHENVSGRWVEEYRGGRYVGDEPDAFVEPIAAAVHAHHPPGEISLYIGCRNGCNYIPLSPAADCSRAMAR
jgi:hypothetical protein